MTRFHEQLKQPTTAAHDRACAYMVEHMSAKAYRAVFDEIARQLFEKRHGQLKKFRMLTAENHVESPVYNHVNGAMTGFVDLLAVSWYAYSFEEMAGVCTDSDDEEVPSGKKLVTEKSKSKCFFGIELKTEPGSVGNTIRQMSVYRLGFVLGKPPTRYGNVTIPDYAYDAFPQIQFPIVAMPQKMIEPHAITLFTASDILLIDIEKAQPRNKVSFLNTDN